MNEPRTVLEHASMPVRDLQSTLRFYRALFPQWSVRWEGKSSRGKRWIHFGDPSSGGSYLSIWENPEIAKADASPCSLRIQHIGFRHPEVGALLSRLKTAGIEPIEVAEDEGYRRAYFTDPDGHELEFVEAMA